MAKEKTLVVSNRLPESLYERLRALAEQDRRSINAELVVLLEQAVGRAERERAAKADEPGNSAPFLLAA